MKAFGFSWAPSHWAPQVEEIKEAFDLFDVDGTQRINPRDLRGSIQALNLRRNQVVHRDGLAPLIELPNR